MDAADVTLTSTASNTKLKSFTVRVEERQVQGYNQGGPCPLPLIKCQEQT